MELLYKALLICVLYFSFSFVLSSQNNMYRSAFKRVTKNIFKPSNQNNNTSLFVVYIFQLIFAIYALYFIPYSDRFKDYSNIKETMAISFGIDLGVVLASFFIVAIFEHFWAFLKDGDGQKKEYLYGSMLILFGLAQFSMVYLYGSMSLEEIVVNQQVSKVISFMSFGVIRNPLLFLASLILLLTYFQNLQKNDYVESNTSVNPIGLLARELTFIGMGIVFIYLYFGGHALPIKSEFVSNNFPPFVKIGLQVLVVFIKTTLLFWCISKVTKRLVYRADFFQSKMMMTIITPLVFLGMVIMPILELWRQL